MINKKLNEVIFYTFIVYTQSTGVNLEMAVRQDDQWTHSVIVIPIREKISHYQIFQYLNPLLIIDIKLPHIHTTTSSGYLLGIHTHQHFIIKISTTYKILKSHISSIIKILK